MSKTRGSRAGRRVQHGRGAAQALNADPVAERVAAALAPDARALLVANWRTLAERMWARIERQGGTPDDAPDWLTSERPPDDAAAIIDRLAVEGFYQPFLDGFERSVWHVSLTGRLGDDDAAHALITLAGVAAGMILGLDHRDGEPVPERALPAGWSSLVDSIALTAWEGRYGQVKPQAVLEDVTDDTGRNPALALLITDGAERLPAQWANLITLPKCAASWPRPFDYMTVVAHPDPDGGDFVEDVVDQAGWLAAVETQRQAWRREAGYLLTDRGQA